MESIPMTADGHTHRSAGRCQSDGECRGSMDYTTSTLNTTSTPSPLPFRRSDSQVSSRSPGTA